MKKKFKRRFSRKNGFLQPCDYVFILVFSKRGQSFNEIFIVKTFDAVGQSFKLTIDSRRVIHPGHPTMPVIKILGGE